MQAIGAAVRPTQKRAVLRESVAQTWATQLDAGVYLASMSTMHRPLRRIGQSADRRNQAHHPAMSKPELMASKPEQGWSGDITSCAGPTAAATTTCTSSSTYTAVTSSAGPSRPARTPTSPRPSSPRPHRSMAPRTSARRPRHLDDVQASRPAARRPRRRAQPPPAAGVQRLRDSPPDSEHCCTDAPPLPAARLTIPSTAWPGD